jgi:serine/threonine-protein kinase
MRPRDARARHATRALVGGRRNGRARHVAPGAVYQQEPRVGDGVTRGQTVTYWVSRGAPRVAVPDVVGSYVDTATAALEDLGLTVDVNLDVGFGEVPGTVVDQDPRPGRKVEEGELVTIWVAVL